MYVWEGWYYFAFFRRIFINIPFIKASNFQNGQFQCLANFLLKHEKQNPSPQLKRAYQK